MCYQSLMDTNIFIALPKIQAIIVGYINKVTYDLQPTPQDGAGNTIPGSQQDVNFETSVKQDNFLSILGTSQPVDKANENIKNSIQMAHNKHPILPSSHSSNESCLNFEKIPFNEEKPEIKKEIDNISPSQLTFQTLVEMSSTNIESICDEMMMAEQVSEASLHGNQSELDANVEKEKIVNDILKSEIPTKEPQKQSSRKRTRKNKFMSDIADDQTDTKLEENLKNTKKNRKYKCAKCDGKVSFSEKFKLTQHRFKKHNERDGSAFVCEECQIIFETLFRFEKHKRNKHPSLAKSLNSEEKPDHCAGSKTLKCHKCEMTFKKPSELQRHLFHVHNERDKNAMVCEMCNLVFTTRYGFQCHKKRHESPSGFQCLFCKEGFPDLNTKKKHEGNCTQKSNYYKQKIPLKNLEQTISTVCTHCKKDHGRVKNLLRHLYVMHNEILPNTFVCKKCKMVFTSLQGLERHKLRHESGSGFICVECNLVFPDYQARHKHKNKMHRATYCKQCSAVFKQSFELKVSYCNYQLLLLKRRHFLLLYL